VRDLKAVLSAALPLLGITYGLLATVPGLRSAAERILPVDRDLAAQLELLPFTFLILGLISGVICATWLFLLARFCRTRGVSAIVNATRVIASAVYASALMPSDWLVTVARWLGPVAVTALIGIALVPTVTVVLLLIKGVLFEGLLVPFVSWMTRVIGARRLTVVTGCVIGALVVTHYNKGWQDTRDSIWSWDPPSKTAERPPITRVFDEWLSRRGIQAGELQPNQEPRKPYPVIIVAAQGGGIYAAAAALVLMASLQEETKGGFAEHLFAISAVSGGAIGASVFRALVAQKAQNTSAALLPAIEKMATDDYISPLLLATPLDWATKVPALVFRAIAAMSQEALSWFGRVTMLARWNNGTQPSVTERGIVIDFLHSWQTVKRAEALKASFLASYQDRFTHKGDDGLRGSVARYWSETTPALVLGATSVETGYRVAFSPFSLAGIGDSTLFAFCDLVGKLKPDSLIKEYEQLSIIDAAVTSARFPGILPAWPIAHEMGRMNFVDGGYADNSGATTAADMLAVLQKHIEDSGLKGRVTLHLVLLTDSETSVDILRVRGTILPDVMAPVMALLNSRQLLASTAVTRAKSQIAERFYPEKPISEVKLDRRLFSLPLGWLLSRHTHRIVSAMLGTASSAKRCGVEGSGQTLSVEDVVRANSCAQKTIADLLR